MCEKWNSGRGGYICDTCRKLLWAGFNGLENPEKRQFVYGIESADIRTTEKRAFCSDNCMMEYTDE